MAKHKVSRVMNGSTNNDRIVGRKGKQIMSG